MANSAEPMTDFGTTASNVFFYYEDVEAATVFYRDVLGARVAADYGFAKIMQIAPKSFITLVDHTKGMHSSDEPKTVAIALVTDQLDEWWDYLEAADVRMRSDDYTPREGSAHDGFVAIELEEIALRIDGHESVMRATLSRRVVLGAHPDVRRFEIVPPFVQLIGHQRDGHGLGFVR